MNNQKPEGYYIEYVYILSRKAAEWGLLITSAIFFGKLAEGFTANQDWSPWVAYFANLMFTLVGITLVDVLMSEIGIFVSNELVADKKREKIERGKKNYLLFCLGVGFALLVTTATMSLWGVGEITHQIVGDFDNSETIKAVENQNKSRNLLFEDAQKELERARNTERSRIRKAKKQGHAIVLSAVNTASSLDHKRHYLTKNKWFRKVKKRRYKALIQYRERIEKAEADSANMVLAEINKVDNLESTKDSTRYLVGSDQTALLLATANVENSKLHAKRSYGIQNGLITLELIMGLIIPVLFYLLALHRKHFGKQVEETNGGMFVMVEKVGSLISRLVTAIGNALAGLLDKMVTGIESIPFAVSTGAMETDVYSTDRQTPDSVGGSTDRQSIDTPSVDRKTPEKSVATQGSDLATIRLALKGARGNLGSYKNRDKKQKAKNGVSTDAVQKGIVKHQKEVDRLVALRDSLKKRL